MHELGITENIIAIAASHAQGAKVRRITLTIGQLSAVMPEAIRFCFDVCARGSPLEGAALEIEEPPRAGAMPRLWPANCPGSTLWPLPLR
jgi:hydrogenase nickel incorporation protein HypA/HybF